MVGLGVGIGQSIASIALAQVGQGQKANIAGLPVSHGDLANTPPIPSKETGDRKTRPARFLLGFGGQEKLIPGGRHAQYVAT